MLYFETGMLIALSGAIIFFSVSSRESVVRAAAIIEPAPDQDLIPVTKEKIPERGKVLKTPAILLDNFIKENNAAKINTDWVFEYPDDTVLPAAYAPEETIDETAPMVFAQQMPSFMGGGLDKFSSWVYGKLRYPEMARQNQISGKVLVQFVIEKDGTLSGIRVVRSPDKLLSDEVVRTLAASPKWNPGIHNNTPVRIAYTLPVDFIISDHR